MFKYYPSLFPADLVNISKPISKAKTSLNKRQKIKRKAQLVIQKIRATQPLTMPSYTLTMVNGIERVYFNYAD